VYHHLSEAEHRWHYFRQQLDAACEMLDERTHAIIHLEHHVEQQGLEVEERVAMIADLEQQLQVLQVPPAPAVTAAPTKPDVELDVDEE
jgi:hypothetical protein